jgi:RNA polymerase sigma-70 factor (ECF subfamily)
VENGNLKQPPARNTEKHAEQDLVDRLKKGQEWAFNQLVKSYQESLLKVAYSITMDTEESLEVVQDVFVSAHKHIATFRQDASLKTWLRKITVNHCLNWKRKWKRRFKWHHQPLSSDADTALFDLNQKSDTPETMIEKKQMAHHLMNEVKRLPEKLRLVFVLSTFERLSYQEIGDMLDIKKGTVSSRLHTARTLLLKKVSL